MISKIAFIGRIGSIKKFYSVTRKASYAELLLKKNILYFKRSNTQKHWKLDINELYKAYRNEDFFNTIVLRKYMSSRVYSPSLGLLIATGLCDSKGNKTNK